ncbi:MAG: restriction endonuclease subunit S [Kiritimatiellales bacterium]
MVKEWTSKPIQKLANIISGGTPSTVISEYWDGSIVWISPTDITRQKTKYLSSSERKITEKGLANSAAVLLPTGTLLLCTRATIGELAIAAQPTATNQGFKNLVCFDNTDNEWLYYAIQPMKSKMIEWASGSTFLEISKTALGNIEILTPPDKDEQRAIATALSDTDAYSAALEKLIAKKRTLKQGAMQELLTGKRRLPGFSGEWVEEPLSKVLKIGHGKNQQEIEVAGGKYPILATSGEIGRTNTFLYNRPSVLIGRKGTIDKPQYMDVPFWTIDTLFYTIIDESKNSKYLYYLFCTIDWANLNEASGVPSLSAGIIEKFEVYCPDDKKEQTAIAEVLSDMDAGIDALTAKLNKAKYIKQGMMSELLTGRIRLVKQNDAAETISAPKIIKLPKAKPAEQSSKGHNKAIENAVILGVVTELYATEKYPLTPFYAQKLPYLLHRHMEGVAMGYHKLAAGPYNAELKYKTALPIAKTNRYITTKKAIYKGTTYQAMLAGENIDQAKRYFIEWHGSNPLKWLEQFKYIKNRRDELELLTTVDMARVELREAGKPVTVNTVKAIIQASQEWKAKLKREIFSDTNIARAIKWSNELFG